MDAKALSAFFVEAIADQRLKAEAERLIAAGQLTPEAHTLADQAIKICAHISDQMRAEQDRLLEVFASQNIAASGVGTQIEQASLQFHSISLRITRAQLADVLRVLKKDGYHFAIETTPARIDALALTSDYLQLVRFDAVTTRIILSFETPPKTMIPKGLRPRTADLALLSLPPKFSFLYNFIKPLRIVKERLTGARSPYHEIDFLGTPEGLIQPILESLDLNAQDVLLDLGCGDGRILEIAAKEFGCRAVGVEHNSDLISKAQSRIDAAGVSDLIELRQGSAETADLSEATIIFMFLPSGILQALMPSIKSRIGENTRLVMHEQSRPKGAFQADYSLPVFAPNGITVVRVQTP